MLMWSYVVAQVGIHQDNEVARARLNAVDVGGAQAELAGSGVQLHLVLAVDLLQLLDDILGAIRRVVVNDDNLHLDVATKLEPGGEAYFCCACFISK